eukprot:TRINITY_DN3091_c0_g3_i1.p1 TRINITY_DN3091_c0_g3~~TRINITY_DN3091_c0_g3_i1.p1  ORF type:complete len:388 (+),score=42.36 TRINITY_DN3091_c0_g3_i1:585-1748(+)
MASVVFLSVAYLAIRLVFWLVLQLSVAITSCCVRAFKGPNQFLYRLLLAYVSSLFIADAVILGYADQHDNYNESEKSGFLGFWVCINAISGALFVLLLIFLSAGYGITRRSIDGLRLRVYGLPVVYLLTQIMMDFSILELQSPDYLDVGNEDRLDFKGVSGRTQGMIIFTFILNILVLVMVCIQIVDFARKEESAIQGMIKEVSGQFDNQTNGQMQTEEGQQPNGDIEEAQGQKESLVRERNPSSDAQADPLDELEAVPPITTPSQKINVLGRAQLRRKLLMVRAYSRMGIFCVLLTLVVQISTMIIAKEEFGAFAIVLSNILMWFVVLWFAVVLRPKSEVGQQSARQNQSDFEMSDIGLKSQPPRQFKKRRSESISPKFALDDEEP